MRPHYLMISHDRFADGDEYELEIVREDLSGLGLPSRREHWIVLARDSQEAQRTVDYHFPHSALWCAPFLHRPREVAL